MTREQKFTQFRRKQIAELRPYVPGEGMEGVSISQADMLAGSPKQGDMIARNPKNHEDVWLVAAQYFADNFEPLAALSAPKAEAEEPCPVCAKPFAAGDTCATDIELGKCHAECLADSPIVDLKTGEPMDGPIGTFPHVALTDVAVERLREELRLVLIRQPFTEDNDTYSDGFGKGLAFAIGKIDALLAAFPSKGDE